MNIIEIIEMQSQPPPVFVNMKRVVCLCHYREVWVPHDEALPFFCNRQQRLLPPAVGING